MFHTTLPPAPPAFVNWSCNVDHGHYPDGSAVACPDSPQFASTELVATSRDPWPVIAAVMSWGFGVVNLVLLLILLTR